LRATSSCCSVQRFQKRFDEAKPVLDRLLPLTNGKDGTSAWTHRRFGQHFVRKRKYDEARKHYEKAERIAASIGYVGLGHIQGDRAQLEEYARDNEAAAAAWLRAAQTFKAAEKTANEGWAWWRHAMVKGRLGAITFDDARWKATSLAARDRAITLYSADRIVPEYEQFYDEVASGALASLGREEAQEAQPVS